jgi:protein-disulfide isomerase
VKWNSRQILILVAAVVVIAAGAIFYFVSRPADVDLGGGTGGSGGGASAGPTKAELMVAGPLGDISEGDANAPSYVIEYASLTCSHCANFHNTVYPEFKKKYVDTRKVYYIFREYPLDPLATSAAMLARCGPQDRAVPMIDLMFDQQDNWAFVKDPKTALINLVKQAGISEADFNTCLTNQTILDGVNAVKDRAYKQFGVDATPTFFINGVEHPGAQTLEELDKVLGG